MYGLPEDTFTLTAPVKTMNMHSLKVTRHGKTFRVTIDDADLAVCDVCSDDLVVHDWIVIEGDDAFTITKCDREDS